MAKNKKVCAIIFSSVPSKNGGIIFLGTTMGTTKTSKIFNVCKISQS